VTDFDTALAQTTAALGVTPETLRARHTNLE
jgi:hypothetical protein